MLLAQSDAASNLESALIGAVAALIVAGIGWYVSTRQNRTGREYQRRQAALTQAQDAALGAAPGDAGLRPAGPPVSRTSNRTNYSTRKRCSTTPGVSWRSG